MKKKTEDENGVSSRVEEGMAGKRERGRVWQDKGMTFQA